MSAQRPSRRRFTIVELLVVICIIMILAGILLAALKTVWLQGEKAQTQELINTLAAGIEKYRDANGDYPPVDGTLPGTSQLYIHLCKTDFGGPFCTISEKFVSNSQFVDSWGNKIAYIRAENYAQYVYAATAVPGSKGPDGALSNSSGVFYNLTTYQLRSLGKDTTSSSASSDDIQNFVK